MPYGATIKLLASAACHHRMRRSGDRLMPCRAVTREDRFLRVAVKSADFADTWLERSAGNSSLFMPPPPRMAGLKISPAARYTAESSSVTGACAAGIRALYQPRHWQRMPLRYQPAAWRIEIRAPP